jgi:penicillin-binding protein 1A
MGFDKPQRIKANAQGGILAAPAWTAFMNEVYQNRAPPGDWPMPPDIVRREIDLTTSLLTTAFCPRALVGTEFFMRGTDPLAQCGAHTDSLLHPDTLRLRPDTLHLRPDTARYFSGFILRPDRHALAAGGLPRALHLLRW